MFEITQDASKNLSWSEGSLVEHAVSNHAIAEEVESDGQVVVVSLKEVNVNGEVGVAHVKHVLKVLNESQVSELSRVKLVKIGKLVLVLLRKLRLLKWCSLLLLFLLDVNRDLILRF